MPNVTDLTPGDRIEIRYRLAANADMLRDKWIPAEITNTDGGVWPLAKLADGQFTEVRRYMQWRYAS